MMYFVHLLKENGLLFHRYFPKQTLSLLKISMRKIIRLDRMNLPANVQELVLSGNIS
jgi:hypothetical protein